MKQHTFQERLICKVDVSTQGGLTDKIRIELPRRINLKDFKACRTKKFTDRARMEIIQMLMIKRPRENSKRQRIEAIGIGTTQDEKPSGSQQLAGLSYEVTR